MMIPLKDYDLVAARHRMAARMPRHLGLGSSPYLTSVLRELTGPADAVKHVAWSVLEALVSLPTSDGGAVRPAVSGKGWVAAMEELRLDNLLVQALMVLRGHPSFPGFRAHSFLHGGEPYKDDFEGGPRDSGPVLERLYAAAPQPWSLDRFHELVFAAACRVYGDEILDDAMWLPREIYPGSRIGRYMEILGNSFACDLFGAFDPGFTRQDALVGEWWLLQPVSPRLKHHALASGFGLEMGGYLPPSAVDVPGRVVMACWETQDIASAERGSMIRESKWMAGWQRLVWAKDKPPLALPGFELIKTLEGITETSYGPYKHSTELPPWNGLPRHGG